MQGQRGYNFIHFAFELTKQQETNLSLFSKPTSEIKLALTWPTALSLTRLKHFDLIPYGKSYVTYAVKKRAYWLQ